MAAPHQFPGDFDGDKVWNQLTKLWGDWQRRSPQAPVIVAGAILLAVLLIWLVTGVYTVGPGEQGVVRRFGKEVVRTGPGLHYHWPRPIERVNIVNRSIYRYRSIYRRL